ncbi:hypothetical protein K7432_008759 [Basidiobolus ranarum]|uniref:Ion transport domain-containing protein n=1 Tax=Basidiobolus ranarum TaxID=34480 RepID=A0ABR2WRD2_9FUNG
MSTVPQQNQVPIKSLHLEPTITLDTIGENHQTSTLYSADELDNEHDEIHSTDFSEVNTNSSEDSSSDEERYAVEKTMSPFRAYCYRFFVQSKSWQARVFFLFSHLLLLLMVISFCLETIPSVYQTESNEWIKFSQSLDISLLIILSVEFAGKFYGWPNRWRFFLDYKNILDLITIVPFFIVSFFESVSSSYFFRVLRLLKVFTLLKIFRVNEYSPGLYVTTCAIKRSIAQILAVSMYFLVAILISSSLVFFVEQGEYDKANRVWVREVNGQMEPSPFQSIVHAFYWSVVTLTTTGYGDVVPVTTLGKTIAGFTMICGVMVIALPTSIIGSNLVSEWENYHRLKFQMEFKHLRTTNGILSPQPIKEKAKKTKALRRQNKQMIAMISEIQERLYDINPPHYYVKYQRLSSKYLDMKRRMNLLEIELEKYKKNAQNSGDGDQSSDHGASVTSNFLLPFRRFRTESSIQVDDSSTPIPRKGRRKSFLHSLILGNTATDDQVEYRKKSSNRLSTNTIPNTYSPNSITSSPPHQSNGESSISVPAPTLTTQEAKSPSKTHEMRKPRQKHQTNTSPMKYSHTDHSIDYSHPTDCTPKHVSKHTISRPFAPRLYSNFASTEDSPQTFDASAQAQSLEIPLTSPTPTTNSSTIGTAQPEYHSVSIDSNPVTTPMYSTTTSPPNQ